MQLPNYRPVEKKVFKICRYMDCGKEFFGRPIQKYCDFHTDPHHRKRIRPVPENPAVRNQVFLHHFSEVTKAEFNCALNGCEERFNVTLYPHQEIYPKYCEHHRSEYQRNYFERLRRTKVAG